MLEFFHRIPTIIKYIIVAIAAILLISAGTRGLTNIAVTGGSIISRDYATAMTYDAESNKTTFEIQAKVFNGDHFTMEVIQYNMEALDTFGEKNQIVSNDIPCSIAPGSTQLTSTSITLTGEYLNIKLVSWKPISWQDPWAENWIGYTVAIAYYAAIAVPAFVAYLKRMDYRKYYLLMVLLFVACLLPAILIPFNWYRFEWVGGAVENGVAFLLLVWALADLILIIKDSRFDLLTIGSSKKLIKTLIKHVAVNGSHWMRIGSGPSLVVSRYGYTAYIDGSGNGAGIFGGKGSEQEYIMFPVTDRTTASTSHGKAFLRDLPKLLEDLQKEAERATGKTYPIKGFIKKA